VVFGSYPAWVNNYYKARLTVEAASEEILEQVAFLPTSLEFQTNKLERWFVPNFSG
jgi:hypothetical protein